MLIMDSENWSESIVKSALDGLSQLFLDYEWTEEHIVIW